MPESPAQQRSVEQARDLALSEAQERLYARRFYRRPEDETPCPYDAIPQEAVPEQSDPEYDGVWERSHEAWREECLSLRERLALVEPALAEVHRLRREIKSLADMGDRMHGQVSTEFLLAILVVPDA